MRRRAVPPGSINRWGCGIMAGLALAALFAALSTLTWWPW